MKQILFILASIAFLQVPANICPGNMSAAYAQKCTIATDVDNVQQGKEATDDELQTEKNFYGFITGDVAGSKKIKDGETLYYTEFPDVNKAFNAMLNLIVPAGERTKFNKSHKYESDLITVVWKENRDGEKAVVEGGFAQVKVKVKKSGVNCTVIFSKR